jgi:hypothetical protein
MYIYQPQNEQSDILPNNDHLPDNNSKKYLGLYNHFLVLHLHGFIYSVTNYIKLDNLQNL